MAAPSAAERKRILLAHIYGVDIDSQAVETTKLSLLLKVLEGESAESIGQTLKFWHERALPDLGANVKCGNSLIGPDFYEQQQMDLFDEEQRLRINVFDWHAEFKEVMRFGGFDAVIGNPPWGQKEIVKDESVTAHLRERFPSLTGIFDLFRPFVEQGVRLLRQDGRFGMVLPDIVLLKDYEHTRRFILENLRIDAIDWWGMAFHAAVIDAATLVGCLAACPRDHLVRCTIRATETPVLNNIAQRQFWRNERLTFNLHLSEERRALLEHLEQWPRLGEVCEIHEGVHSGNVRAQLFVDHPVDKTCYPLLFGRDEIAPYLLHWNGKYVRLSAVPKHRTREHYANAGRPEWYSREKVLVRRTGDYVLAAVDRERRYASNNFFLVFPRGSEEVDLDALCALLNSPLMTWYFRAIEPRKGRVFAELKIKHLERFPMALVTENQSALADLSRLGRERSACGQRRTKVRTEHERVALSRSVAQCDAMIARLVYDVFRLPEAWRELVTKETTNGETEDKQVV